MTNAEFTAALKATASGGTLRVPPGVYVGLRPGLVKPTSTVTITAADPADPPVFRQMICDGWENVTFDGVAFDVSNATAEHIPALSLNVGKAISVLHCRFTGKQNTDGSRWGFGIQANKVQGLTVAKSDFGVLARGVVLGIAAGAGCDDVTVTHNDFHELSADGVNFHSVLRLVVSENYFGAYHWVGGTHPDAIQGMDLAGSVRANQNITIENNCVDADPAFRPQGVFLRSESLRPYVGPIRVRDNLLCNTMMNGIAMPPCDTLYLEGNTVLFVAQVDPKAQPKQSRISTSPVSGKVSILNNRAMSFGLSQTPADVSNVVIPAATQAEVDAAVAAWRSRFRAAAPPAPPPPTELEIAQAEIARLGVEAARLQARIVATTDQLTTTQAELVALQTWRDQVKATVATAP